MFFFLKERKKDRITFLTKIENCPGQVTRTSFCYISKLIEGGDRNQWKERKKKFCRRGSENHALLNLAPNKHVERGERKKKLDIYFLHARDFFQGTHNFILSCICHWQSYLSTLLQTCTSSLSFFLFSFIGKY